MQKATPKKKGNSNVFRWHHDWPVTFGSMIHCVLMAVERWF
jgi:hypothetical protein